MTTDTIPQNAARNGHPRNLADGLHGSFNPSVLGSNPSAPPFTSGVIAPDITDSHDGDIFTNGLCVAKVTAKDSCVTVAAMRV
jgi:hypothetical protein